ncbi:hypothetical protein E2562_022009 [Oryza meyeriana var. granulata]|uniref:Uncharacterized protein n=1 Tax=Oryza meyeriana var. granulata TaxID=110450 RepID=A0A6G1ENH7_9ORYZ|nr:hypothetical protein E2562_022009 [Oryza meyeriana var. granulata]
MAAPEGEQRHVATESVGGEARGLLERRRDRFNEGTAIGGVQGIGGDWSRASSESVTGGKHLPPRREGGSPTENSPVAAAPWWEERREEALGSGSGEKAFGMRMLTRDRARARDQRSQRMFGPRLGRDRG